MPRGAGFVQPGATPATPAGRLFRLPGSAERDPRIETWMLEHAGELGAIARRWFDAMRGQGPDVREILHDGQPTACVQDAAFGYVDAFRAHVNVGFFRGDALADPAHLLQGTGKFMRHVKLRPGTPLDEAALLALVRAACADMRARVAAAAALQRGPAP